MRLSIGTWNSQGSPLTNADKYATLKGLIGVCDVVLLQECGSLATVPGFEGYRVVSWEAAGAKNHRCSTAILTPRCDETGNAGHMSTGRAAVWIRCGNVYIATIHCTASGKAADQTQLMKEMAKIAGNNPLIIGGDFNCTPVGEEMNVGTSSREITFNVDAQARATQRSGRTLDYFVSQNAECLGTRKYQTGESDHDAVTATYRV
jgi:endonuclease/exonuclease/phosphatase (EEP) superfamily protein YafD